MIHTETVIYGTKEYVRTWSDLEMMIERDGIRYEEAIDPIDSGRTYTETDEAIPVIEDAYDSLYPESV